ncbi:MAG: DUF4956 domain-containing protein [bacterium]
MNELFGASMTMNWDDLGKLVARLALDLIFVSIVIRLVYFRINRNREFVFTYYLFNVITLCMCLLLRKVPTELGLALALFGVFGILRYRTEQIRIRDLTYLFIVIGLGLLNGVANKNTSLAELLVVNGVIVSMTAALELRPWKRSEHSTPILYDRLELLRPGREAELMADINTKTGLDAARVEIHRVDLLRDSAEISVYHSNPR